MKSRVPVVVLLRAKGGEGSLVQALAVGTHLVQPLLVLSIADRVRVEVHLVEASTAVVRRTARESTGFFSDQVQLGFHPGHGVDHRPQVRNEEHVHHGVGSDTEVQRVTGAQIHGHLPARQVPVRNLLRGGEPAMDDT